MNAHRPTRPDSLSAAKLFVFAFLLSGLIPLMAAESSQLSLKGSRAVQVASAVSSLARDVKIDVVLTNNTGKKMRIPTGAFSVGVSHNALSCDVSLDLLIEEVKKDIPLIQSDSKIAAVTLRPGEATLFEATARIPISFKKLVLHIRVYPDAAKRYELDVFDIFREIEIQ